jgi:roadblock/LC7 domain-containing protein
MRIPIENGAPAAGDAARKGRLVVNRSQKITFAEMRSSGVRVSWSIAQTIAAHWIAISGDRWPDDVRLSDIEGGFVCTVCGTRGADVRPDFDWALKQEPA